MNCYRSHCPSRVNHSSNSYNCEVGCNYMQPEPGGSAMYSDNVVSTKPAPTEHVECFHSDRPGSRSYTPINQKVNDFLDEHPLFRIKLISHSIGPQGDETLVVVFTTSEE